MPNFFLAFSGYRDSGNLEQAINYLCLPQPRLQIAVHFLGIRATKTNPAEGLVLIYVYA